MPARGYDQQGWSGLPVWNPQLLAPSKFYEHLITVAIEYQQFVARRLQEHKELTQAINRSPTPDQVRDAYAHFWNRASEDYADAMTKLSKLMVDMTAEMMTAAQSDIDQARANMEQARANMARTMSEEPHAQRQNIRR